MTCPCLRHVKFIVAVIVITKAEAFGLAQVYTTALFVCVLPAMCRPVSHILRSCHAAARSCYTRASSGVWQWP